MWHMHVLLGRTCAMLSARVYMSAISCMPVKSSASCHLREHSRSAACHVCTGDIQLAFYE